MPVGTLVQVRLQDDELNALDHYRREKLNPPSRPRALRELAQIALSGSSTSPSQSAIAPSQQGVRTK
jgi:hypothetical protein